MAIAHDSATDHGWSNTTSYSASATSPSSDDRVLLVTIFSNSSSDVVTGVTYGGVSMTRVAAEKAQSNQHTMLYYLIAPATGSNNVVVTNSSSTLTSVHTSFYTGVSQTGFPDASNSANAQTVASLEVSVTTTVDNCWLAGAGVAMSGGTAFDSNTTVRAGDATQTLSIDGGGVTSPAGSDSLKIKRSSGANDNFALIVVSMAPAGGGSAPTENANFAFGGV